MNGIDGGAPDQVLERRILRKVGWRILPILLLGFLISFIDRANVGVLYGPLTHSLGLTASSFGLAAGLFYIGYLVFEIPSNLAMAKYGARVWLARILVTWGFVTVALAAAQGVTSFYILRILLGVAEAGFYPGALFFLTLWYPPRALGRAYSLFEISIPASLAIGSLLTSSLLLLDGVWGIAGWKWVFILEGLPAIALGLYIFFVLPDNPDKATWLTAEETCYLNSQLLTRHESAKSELGKVAVIFQSGLAWIFAALYFSFVIGFWAVTYFLPKIVQERFHVGVVQAGAISAIPWIVAVLAIIVVSRTSAKTRDRRWHMLVLLGLAGIGLLMSAAVASPILALIGIAMGAAGMQAATPLFWTMPSTVFRGAMAAVALAMVNSLGNLSGLAGPWILGFFSDVTGSSRVGLYIMSGFFFVSAILAFAVSTAVTRRRDVIGSPSLEQPIGSY
ncbi:major Facilitator Superfamily protein [Paraburkholderia xenovorans LB400]|uniref:Major facilitator superfamily (MFS) metabolite/H+ symporter n=1 Tax=Paraburkholderia xenovorans (strain LB400) TaxID=266265 RepID=Q143W2_PARXL|nr:MFS transporter [Paraburkholderia xenovorans]ABE29377.1 Major facilitator superfamily (MFS) metabolite/H+ symporter [Paraburkholderia xenovorans LB400]AIP30569.1 major Facilitator Superfamily protein [Paraburkholderia xenovorans LB400]